MSGLNARLASACMLQIFLKQFQLFDWPPVRISPGTKYFCKRLARNSFAFGGHEAMHEHTNKASKANSAAHSQSDLVRPLESWLKAMTCKGLISSCCMWPCSTCRRRLI